MSTPTDRCAHAYLRHLDGQPAVCDVRRYLHGDGGWNHAFVEPAPQPPADAASDQLRNCPKTGRQCMCVDVRSDCEPAAPTVSGDGGEARAIDVAAYNEATAREITTRTIAQKWRNEWVDEDGEHTMEQCFENAALEAYAAGLERGRALGARDEQTSIVKELLAAACVACGHERCNSFLRTADAIARRSGGQGQ
jgi:hypothetical protein